MFCTSCGNKIADKAIICVRCSAPVISFTKDGKAYALDILTLKPYKVEQLKIFAYVIERKSSMTAFFCAFVSFEQRDFNSFA